MLSSVLDANITKNVVRLGSRATDQRIEQYSLYRLEELSGRASGDLERPIKREYATMKRAEEEMTCIVNLIQLPELSWEDAERFLDFHYPLHADSFRDPPFWVAELLGRKRQDEIENGEWTRVSKKGKQGSKDPEISGVYGFWKNGEDIEFIQPRPSTSKSAAGKKGNDPDPRVAFFNDLGFGGLIPPIPYGDRPLDSLTNVDNVWSMSYPERQRLAESWEEDMQHIAYDSCRAEFDQLREERKACKDYEDIKDEVSWFSGLCRLL